jgi:hypothetical protein
MTKDQFQWHTVTNLRVRTSWEFLDQLSDYKILKKDHTPKLTNIFFLRKCEALYDIATADVRPKTGVGM